MGLSIDLFGFASGLPRNLTRTASGLAISVGEAQSINVFYGTTLGALNPAFSYLGGESGPLGSNYPKTAFVGTFNLSYTSGPRTGLGGSVAFRTDAQTFDAITYCAGFASQFDVYIDGVLLRGAPMALPSDGSVRRVTIDYSAAGIGAGMHTVELVYNGSTAFGGLYVPTGSTVAAIGNSGPRMVVLGDSFTEGTGAIDYANSFAKLTGRNLGLRDIWTSGEGGTGYEAVLSNRANLDNRIVADGVNAHAQIYVVAMGLNDSTSSVTLEATISSTLGKLVSGAPNAKIFVLGPWNPQAGLAYPKAQVEAAIERVSKQFPNITYLDPSTIPFSKVDPTHPDQAGHQVLTEWLTERIRSTMAADGVVEQGVAGDIVGPLSIGGWTSNASYVYTVYENGSVSDRFEVIDNGTAFPVLRLKPNAAVAAIGSIQLEIQVQSSTGESILQTVSFGVREHIQGTANSERIAGQGLGTSIDAGAGDDTLVGTAGADRLDGGTGNDWLDGRGGDDNLLGGQGDDYYLVDSYSDVLVEEPGGGIDLIYTGLTRFALPDNFEKLILLGGSLDGAGNELDNFIKGNANDNKLTGFGGNDKLSGEAGNDTLNGGAGDDYLAGGAGTDLLIGGQGDDAYLVEDANDTISEQPNEGRDTVYSAIASFTLPTYFEHLTLVGSAVEGVGNAVANQIEGNALANQLYGLDGNDGLNGAGGNDSLYGGAGNDYLDGGSGTDALYGGIGDDTFVVDSSADVVIELTGEGYDTVYSRAATYTLPDQVERGIAAGSSPQAINGNGSNNTIFGNALDNQLDGGGGNDSIDGGLGNDTIWGSDGDDQLNGGGGNDQLLGGNGNDWLAGGDGTDWLSGGAGNDTFLIQDANDQIVEQENEGVDWAYSEVASYTLASNVERLKLYGLAARDGYGNELDNLLSGNGLDNLLDGGAGNDYIDGGSGDDMLIGGTGGDWLVGGAGNDTARYDTQFSSFSYQFYADGSLAIRNLATGEIDRLLGVESLIFGADHYTVDWAAHSIFPG